MGEPYFKIKTRLKALGVKVKSSNYELYGDISRRLMIILKKQCEELEIYSIDEAFATLTRPKNMDLHPWAINLRSMVNLPSGTGKKVKVAVVCEEAKIKEAKESGADIVGGDDLIEKIKGDKPELIDKIQSTGKLEEDTEKILKEL